MKFHLQKVILGLLTPPLCVLKINTLLQERAHENFKHQVVNIFFRKENWKLPSAYWLQINRALLTHGH